MCRSAAGEVGSRHQQPQQQKQQQKQLHHKPVANKRSLELCAARYHEYTTPLGVLYCNWTWDQVLCWPPTRAGTTATQRCPRDKGIDPTKFATKKCSPEGRWEGKHPGDDTSSPQGWTNYTPCYTPEMLELFRKLYVGSEKAAMNKQEDKRCSSFHILENTNNGRVTVPPTKRSSKSDVFDDTDADEDIIPPTDYSSDSGEQKKLEIAERTRTLEIVGFSISLAALLISLAIFCHFRSLRNNRTRIHKNLFVAMVIQVVIRLTLYIDQAIVKGNTLSGQRSSSGGFRQGIDNTPVLCEASYVLLEYARTAMFMWMFIEGLYLHNMVTVTVFQEKSYYAAYTAVGWGVPVLMTAAWAMTTASTLGSTRCWWGYNLNKFFWILEGPRLVFILLNFLFLLNIIRVLVVKLRQSHTSEIEQVRKAVRAAVVLLPLLGITNLVNMTEAPLTRAVWEFGLWSYTTHFLTSFQGLFIAILYCFLNGEVRIAVRKSVSTYLSLRPQHFTPQRRNSAFVSANMTEQVVSTPPPRTASRSWLRSCCSHPSQPTPETRV